MHEDIELMLQVQKNDLDAYEKLFKKYSRPIGNFFLRMGCGVEACEDCVQEVFMRIWRARINYQPKAKFTTFLFQIAKNYWINESEKKKRRPATYNIEENDYIPQDRNFSHDGVPEKNVLSRELKEKIQESIGQLSENYRLVFVLSEFEGLKYREIAEILEIPIGTVKSRMATAEQKLRDKLASYTNME